MISSMQIADDVPLPLLMFSAGKFELEWLNLSAQFWLGSSMKSLSGKSIDAVFHRSSELEEILQLTSERMSSVQNQGMLIRPRGRDEESAMSQALCMMGALDCAFSLRVVKP